MKKLVLLFTFLGTFACALLAQDSTAYRNFNGGGIVQNKQYISVPTPASSPLRMTGSWTIETWVYVPDTVISSQQIYLVETYGFSANGGFVLRLNNLNVMAYQIQGPSVAVSTVGSTMVQLNAWNHVAATYDDANQKLSVYLNGNMDSQVNCPLSTSNTNDNLYIGARGDDQNVIQNVTFDEVRIWNIAKTDTAIASDMYACLTGSESNLLLHYNFESTSGNMISDNSINGNTGVMINFDSLSLVDGAYYCGSTVGIPAPAPSTFSAFPNPMKDRLMIRSESQPQSIEILDLQGSKVMQLNTQLESANNISNTSNGQFEIELDITALPKGIYLLRLQNTTGIQNLKVIKE